MRRPFGPITTAIIRKFYGRLPADDLARELHRTVNSLYCKAKAMGLCHPFRVRSARNERYLRAQHARGWTDSMIAPKLRCARKTVSDWRRGLKLPSNAFSAVRIEAVRQKTLEQCRAAGVANLGALRAKVLGERSAKMGWPVQLPWRAAQILTALWETGPMTRQQIVEAIRPDLVGKCTRARRNKALMDNARYGGGTRGNSYLGNLMRRGLVVYLGRIVRTGRRGGNVGVYSLPLGVQRGAVEEGRVSAPGTEEGNDVPRRA